MTLDKAKRNDPCPCGSGKKYKKCCYNKDKDKSFTATHYQQGASKMTSLFAQAVPSELKPLSTRKINVVKKGPVT